MGFTIEQLAEFFWRVEELEFSFDVSTVVNDGGDITVGGNSSYLYLDPITKHFLNSELGDQTNIGDWQDIEYEAQLATGFTDAATVTTGKIGSCVFINEYFLSDAFAYPVVGSWSRPSGSPSSGDTWLYNYEFLVNFWDVISVEADGVELFYPRMDFWLIIATDIVLVPVAVVFSSSDQGATSATIPLTICGATTDLQVYRGAPTPSSAAVSATGSITIAPSSWWSYGGKWNTTTGARI